jgi:type II secretory pathway pseudopilin PulG
MEKSFKPFGFRTLCNCSAFTLIEILVVIATFAILFVILLPALAKQKSKRQRIACVNNLKGVGLSFRLWVADGDKWSTMVSTNYGGSLEYVNTPDVFRHFRCLSNELGAMGATKVLVCPSDVERIPASDFLTLSNVNLSYFVGADGTENEPNTIVSGDRNITNGFSPTNGMLYLNTNQNVGWTKGLHKFQGNIAIGDGSVQQVNSARLQHEILSNATIRFTQYVDVPTPPLQNRIVIP